MIFIICIKINLNKKVKDIINFITAVKCIVFNKLFFYWNWKFVLLIRFDWMFYGFLMKKLLKLINLINVSVLNTLNNKSPFK